MPTAQDGMKSWPVPKVFDHSTRTLFFTLLCFWAHRTFALETSRKTYCSSKFWNESNSYIKKAQFWGFVMLRTLFTHSFFPWFFMSKMLFGQVCTTWWTHKLQFPGFVTLPKLLHSPVPILGACEECIHACYLLHRREKNLVCFNYIPVWMKRWQSIRKMYMDILS